MDDLFAFAEKSKDHVDNIDPCLIEEALRIRLVEETFLELFSLGKMNGTVLSNITEGSKSNKK